MFILPHKSFVSYYEKYGSGKRYCFKTSSYKEAIILTVEEVINCIADCANEYCNWRYKIIPENEFLVEYEEYKNNLIKWRSIMGLNFKVSVKMKDIGKSEKLSKLISYLKKAKILKS